jgi:hypothetical protein
MQQFRGPVYRKFSYMKENEFEEFVNGKKIEIPIFPWDNSQTKKKLTLHVLKNASDEISNMPFEDFEKSTENNRIAFSHFSDSSAIKLVITFSEVNQME